MTYEEIEMEVALIVAHTGPNDAWDDIPDEFQCHYRADAERIIRRLVEIGAMPEPAEMPPP